jgi:hypothetical protein
MPADTERLDTINPGEWFIFAAGIIEDDGRWVVRGFTSLVPAQSHARRSVARYCPLNVHERGVSD